MSALIIQHRQNTTSKFTQTIANLKKKQTTEKKFKSETHHNSLWTL